jgi:hypothetical protein
MPVRSIGMDWPGMDASRSEGRLPFYCVHFIIWWQVWQGGCRWGRFSKKWSSLPRSTHLDFVPELLH